MSRFMSSDGYLDDREEEARCDAIDERRRMARLTTCACFGPGEAPGHCPGQASCPMCETDEGENHED